MNSPLVDTLFRSTALSPIVASAAPVRERGTRTRAGNAMNRTRAALMIGAAAAVAESGTKITMSHVAAEAGVAKATLYNHFRTREAVLAALVLNQVEEIIAAQQGKPLEAALTDAALAISEHPVRAGLAGVEPGTLAALGRIDTTTADGWRTAAEALTEALTAAGRAGDAIVLRWLASFLLTPGRPAAIAADVQVLVAALPRLDAPQPGPGPG